MRYSQKSVCGFGSLVCILNSLGLQNSCFWNDTVLGLVTSNIFRSRSENLNVFTARKVQFAICTSWPGLGIDWNVCSSKTYISIIRTHQGYNTFLSLHKVMLWICWSISGHLCLSTVYTKPLKLIVAFVRYSKVIDPYKKKTGNCHNSSNAQTRCKAL